MNHITNTVMGLLLLLCLLNTIDGFYLPGVAPRSYPEGANVKVKVNKLDSVRTQLPFDYYSLPFCKPPEGVVEDSENLGEILSGDQIETSAYKVDMLLDEVCRVLCRRTYKETELADFADKIEDEYRVNMIVDNLPAATKFYVPSSSPDANGEVQFDFHYAKGFALGLIGSERDPRTVEGVKYINNHLRLVLQYHRPSSSLERYRVVGFEVEPFSVRHVVDGDPEKSNRLKTCGVHNPVTHESHPQAVSGVLSPIEKTILWTYDVKWEESPIRWASRWDVYLKMTDNNIHWFSIVNSIMIVLFLTGIVGMILLRTVHRDLARYNLIDDSEEAQQEESGWKLVYSEVFRPPQCSKLFAVIVGSGVQVIAMALLTLFFALLGFLSPANRGGLMTSMLLLFVFMGCFAGYYAVRACKMFNISEWKYVTFWTALAFPGMVFTVFFILNLMVWGKHSSGAVPFSTLVALLVLWFGISVPLVYVGAYFGFKKPADPLPCTVNNIPRMIPEQPWFIESNLSVLVGGILPFGAVFIEIFFILSSVWLHQFYYVFGVLFIVFVILVITCAEIAISITYFQLCAENYHWWWRSIFIPGSSALYLFLYSVLYFDTKLNITSFVPACLYFGYMFLSSVAFFLVTGTVGFLSTHWFVHTIYSSIKVD